MARLSRTEALAVEAFARGVRACVGERAQSVRLFGSRARGEGHDESDLDVLVLVAEMTREERRRIQDVAFDVGLAHRLVLSPLVADADAWRGDLPLTAAIARDGVDL